MAYYTMTGNKEAALQAKIATFSESEGGFAFVKLASAKPMATERRLAHAVAHMEADWIGSEHENEMSN